MTRKHSESRVKILVIISLEIMVKVVGLFSGDGTLLGDLEGLMPS